MTTDEALEYCKRFDDPKLQSAMATDFSRATGTVGALLALRAALAERDAKIREFWNWMDGQLIPLSVELLKNAEARSPEFRKTKARGQAFFDALMKMRELGLITEEPK